MENHVIQYETAVLAKSKGFDEPTEMYYHIYDDIDRGQSSLESTGGCKSFLNSLNTYRCAAPEQPELQRWLRDKHNVSVEVNFSAYLGGFIPSYIKMTKRQPGIKAYLEAVGTTIAVMPRLTYERALEVGLARALEVIEPKQNKNQYPRI